MVEIKLAKPWLEYAIGDTVQVDPLRAQWLRDNGYEEETATVLKIGDVDLSDRLMRTIINSKPDAPVSESDDEIPLGHMVSRGVRKVYMTKLCEPLPDLEAHPPVVDLSTPNQDPLKD